MVTNKEPSVDTRFSCDLVTNSILHREFLVRVHQLGITLKPLAHESLRRYRDLWLPLVHQHATEELIPPPDIAWLWHCHRLAPSHYVTFITKRFGINAAVDANPPFALQGEKTSKAATDGTPAAVTRLLWEQTYADEPFFIRDTLPKETSKPSSEANECIGEFDLLRSTQRQSKFLWQVSGERFDDKAFLEQGRDNYYRFLTLQSKASERKIILVPTYQIDLMWHTHILTSITKYNEDCKAIMGTMFHHDDSLSNRTKGSILDVSYQATRQLWMDVYGEEYAVQGGMYRGEPHAAYFKADWIEKKALQDDHPKAKDSSTSKSQQGPAVWAKVDGKTSDGYPAFLKVKVESAQDLKHFSKQDNYVFGKTATHGFGYYHLETREAIGIVLKRIELHRQRLESDIAMDQSCCGNRSNSYSIAFKEKELAKTKALQVEMKARYAAERPNGKVKARSETPPDKAPNGTRETPYLYSDNGIWLYPPYVWDSSGGACGGSVAYNMTATGGACGGGACDNCCDGSPAGDTDCNCDGGGACGGNVAGAVDVLECCCNSDVDVGGVADVVSAGCNCPC